jgi:hypothetical protein
VERSDLIHPPGDLNYYSPFSHLLSNSNPGSYFSSSPSPSHPPPAPSRCSGMAPNSGS